MNQLKTFLMNIFRCFKIMDDSKDNRLQFEEFRKGITEHGLNYSKEDMKELFNAFDTDHSGHLDFDEFLEKLRVKTKKQN